MKKRTRTYMQPEARGLPTRLRGLQAKLYSTENVCAACGKDDGAKLSFCTACTLQYHRCGSCYTVFEHPKDSDTLDCCRNCVSLEIGRKLITALNKPIEEDNELDTTSTVLSSSNYQNHEYVEDGGFHDYSENFTSFQDEGFEEQDGPDEQQAFDYENDKECCVICGDIKYGNEFMMILCSTCLHGYHLKCLNLAEIPKGAWYCSQSCVLQNDSEIDESSEPVCDYDEIELFDYLEPTPATLRTLTARDIQALIESAIHSPRFWMVAELAREILPKEYSQHQLIIQQGLIRELNLNKEQVYKLQKLLPFNDVYGYARASFPVPNLYPKIYSIEILGYIFSYELVQFDLYQTIADLYLTVRKLGPFYFDFSNRCSCNKQHGKFQTKICRKFIAKFGVDLEHDLFLAVSDTTDATQTKISSLHPFWVYLEGQDVDSRAQNMALSYLLLFFLPTTSFIKVQDASTQKYISKETIMNKANSTSLVKTAISQLKRAILRDYYEKIAETQTGNIRVNVDGMSKRLFLLHIHHVMDMDERLCYQGLARGKLPCTLCYSIPPHTPSHTPLGCRNFRTDKILREKYDEKALLTKCGLKGISPFLLANPCPFILSPYDFYIKFTPVILHQHHGVVSHVFEGLLSYYGKKLVTFSSEYGNKAFGVSTGGALFKVKSDFFRDWHCIGLTLHDLKSRPGPEAERFRQGKATRDFENDCDMIFILLEIIIYIRDEASGILIPRIEKLIESFTEKISNFQERNPSFTITPKMHELMCHTILSIRNHGFMKNCSSDIGEMKHGPVKEIYQNSSHQIENSLRFILETNYYRQAFYRRDLQNSSIPSSWEPYASFKLQNPLRCIDENGDCIDENITKKKFYDIILLHMLQLPLPSQIGTLIVNKFREQCNIQFKNIAVLSESLKMGIVYSNFNKKKSDTIFTINYKNGVKNCVAFHGKDPSVTPTGLDSEVDNIVEGSGVEEGQDNETSDYELEVACDQDSVETDHQKYENQMYTATLPPSLLQTESLENFFDILSNEQEVEEDDYEQPDECSMPNCEYHRGLELYCSFDKEETSEYAIPLLFFQEKQPRGCAVVLNFSINHSFMYNRIVCQCRLGANSNLIIVPLEKLRGVSQVTYHKGTKRFYVVRGRRYHNMVY